MALGILLSMCALSVSAQEFKLPVNEPNYNQPKLFNDLPPKMNLHMDGLEHLFHQPAEASVSFHLSDIFKFEGTIISRSVSGDTLVQSIVIRCSNRPGAVFTLTRTQDKSGALTYVGRIMNFNNIDAYVIGMEKGEYVLIKKNLYDLLSE